MPDTKKTVIYSKKFKREVFDVQRRKKTAKFLELVKAMFDFGRNTRQ
jgi:hypothetical protein